ncbi:hypothetical protein EOD41_16880 [Mucilaginibacter limnophilus]|uniref:Uncharacterized protein n=1 Tax=Mucilaginibacter limnophilus TaxID=1932778 RepID=A0A437MLH1_9SPHI|nr:hypothetical protein [Mucilaginibacter limnophilus]RVT98463.1 hypothetical protein EOD41_16880 [Mucilaginibacter limnophilus]
MNPLDFPQITDLSQAVGYLIKNQLANAGTVSTVANQVIICISRFEIEHRLGNLLQQIYRTVDQQFPVRKDDLSLVIRDAEGLYENTFKIWKSSS